MEKPSDIDIIIRRPDGTLEIPDAMPMHYIGVFKYDFKATMDGYYTIQLHNTNSYYLGKYVDIAIDVLPPPCTIAETRAEHSTIAVIAIIVGFTMGFALAWALRGKMVVHGTVTR